MERKRRRPTTISIVRNCVSACYCSRRPGIDMRVFDSAVKNENTTFTLNRKTDGTGR